MSSYKDPDLKERQGAAAAAKKAILEKFRAASDDPAIAARDAARAAVSEARRVRAAEREAAKEKLAAERAEQAARTAELAAQAQREAEATEARTAAEKEELGALLKAEQKEARDARYAARKAAKKERRRGY